LVIPKTLANNAALDAIDLIAQLRVLHSASQNSDDEKKKELRFCGLDLVNNKCRNNLKAGVLEPANSKIKAIRYFIIVIIILIFSYFIIIIFYYIIFVDIL
jgi:T-complex protein 1 subunit alpha